MNVVNYVLGSIFLFAGYAVLNRYLGLPRDEMFSLVFAVVGLVLLAAGVFSSCRAKKVAGRAEESQTSAAGKR